MNRAGCSLVLLLLLACLVPAGADAAEEGGPPPPGIARALKTAAPEVQLVADKPKSPPKPPDNKPGPRPTRIGEHRTLAAAQLAKGAWLKTAGQEPLWRLAVRSKGAAAMRLHFQEFRVAAGKVWVHNGKEWFGPYTDRGMYGDGDFWSHVVPGDRLVLEYVPPAEAAAAPAKAPPFTVKSVSHLTSNPFDAR